MPRDKKRNPGRSKSQFSCGLAAIAVNPEPKPVKKQYTYENAYTNNYHFIKLEDGRIVSHSIVAGYELSVYISMAEAEGYELGYYVRELDEAVKRAEEALLEARRDLERAKQNSSPFTEQDEVRYREILYLDEPRR